MSGGENLFSGRLRLYEMSGPPEGRKGEIPRGESRVAASLEEHYAKKKNLSIHPKSKGKLLLK